MSVRMCDGGLFEMRVLPKVMNLKQLAALLTLLEMQMLIGKSISLQYGAISGIKLQ